MKSFTPRPDSERKARIAARLWLRAQRGSLTARDRRLARIYSADPEVTNDAISSVVQAVETEHFVRIWTTARVLPRPITIRL